MIPVDTSPIAKLTTTTATSMMFIGLRNWPNAMAHTDGGASLVISFGPNRSSRFAASAALSPDAGSVPSDAATSAASQANGGMDADAVAETARPCSASTSQTPSSGGQPTNHRSCTVGEHARVGSAVPSWVTPCPVPRDV